MTLAILGLVMDVLVGGLLVATIVFALRLNRQLSAVKDSRAEFEAFVRDFGEATAQAEASVKGMRLAASEGGEQLRQLIGKAQTLKDELELMVQAADAMASRLEASSGRARQAAAPNPTANPAPSAATVAPRGAVVANPAPAAAAGPLAGGAEPRSRAERELLQALENIRQ